MPIARKERVHGTGASNRADTWKPRAGPIDFDASMRSTLPKEYRYHLYPSVPMSFTGVNKDFSQTMPGCDYRKGETLVDTQVQMHNTARATMKASDELALTQKVHQVTETAGQTSKKPFGEAASVIKLPARGIAHNLSATAPIVRAPPSMKLTTLNPQDEALGKDAALKLPATNKATHKSEKVDADRWNPRFWWEPLPNELQPKNKSPNTTWNARDSDFPELRKGSDHLFRAARSKAEIYEEDRLKEKEDLNRLAEYYPRRELVDLVKRVDAGGDSAIRPVYLPDFAYFSKHPNNKTYNTITGNDNPTKPQTI